MPLRWLPALRESTAAGVERPYLERALALWLHYLATARDESGRPLMISDPGAAALGAALSAAGDAAGTVRAALDSPALAGSTAWPDTLIVRVGTHLSTLREHGTDALLAPLYAR